MSDLLLVGLLAAAGAFSGGWLFGLTLACRRQSRGSAARQGRSELARRLGERYRKEIGERR